MIDMAKQVVKSRVRQAGPVEHEVVIIGAGFGGLGAAIALGRAGVDDFVIIDKQAGVGGCWRANRYPGVAVDIPGTVYSFSHSQRGDWSRLYAPGAELARYAESVAADHDLLGRVRTATTVTGAAFDADGHRWIVDTHGPEGVRQLTGRWLIAAHGPLERPAMPDIAGIDRFAGAVVHTARWDETLDLHGARVAVIGTGASAVQVVPEIAERVAHLDVYQRTPIWVAPRFDPVLDGPARWAVSRPVPRALLRAAATAGIDLVGNIMLNPWLRPVGTRVETALRQWMRSQVHDPELAERLIPAYGFGCKRPAMSNRYLATFNRDNVELVTDPIAEITAAGVVTRDGRERPVDVLVCATGFKIHRPGDRLPFPIRGRGGIDLGERWDTAGAASYQGVTVPGFPNLFTIAGPLGFVVGSYFWMLESTAEHSARVIAQARRRGATYAEIREEPFHRYVERCRGRQQRSSLFDGTCAGSNTYYVSPQGECPLRPSTYAEMWWENRHFPLDNYRFRTLPGRALGMAA